MCSEENKKYNIALLGEFFYPDIGGVELHMLTMAKELFKQGHHVIVISKACDNRRGVRYLAPGIKVYYLPIKILLNKRVIKSVYIDIQFILYDILKREKIEILHIHQLSSYMGICSTGLVPLLELRLFITLHSLFDLKAVEANILSKVNESNGHSVDSYIAVSNITRENLAIFNKFNFQNIAVIPNGIDTTLFKPNKNINTITYTKDNIPIIKIVVLTRLYYRKGVNFIIELIPILLSKYNNLEIHIGGTGELYDFLKHVINIYNHNDKVFLYGNIDSENACEFLNRGDFFLNTSIIESFCMAVLEAVACGLYCVSTNVGGISELLPNNILYLSEPCIDNLLQQIDIVYKLVLQEKIENNTALILKRKQEFHTIVSEKYKWKDVARKTVKLYDYYFSKEKPKFNILIIYYYLNDVIGFIYILIGYVLLIIYSFIYDKFMFKHEAYFINDTSKKYN